MKKTGILLASLMMLTSLAYGADRTGQTIRLGIDPSYPPLDYKLPDGSLTGFSVDVMNAICTQMKANCVWVEMSFDGLIPALQARKVDAVASSLVITEKREKQIAFTDKISNSPSILVAKKGPALLPTAESLKGKRLGVEQGSSQEAYAKAKWQREGVEIVTYANQDLVYSDLVSGRIDATLAASIQVDVGFLKKPIGADYAIMGQPLTDPEFFGRGSGIGLRKNEQELRDDINAALNEIIKNGIYKKINEKYFDFDMMNY